MATRLFVGGLSWGTTEDALRDLFAQAGNVVSVTVITDKFTGKSKGFGFVEMGSEEEAKAAIEKFNNYSMDGRTINVNEARPMADREDRGGFRGGDNRGGFRRDGGNRGGGGRGRSRY
ncbi:hypothetical protein A3D84_00185 [Candidatus Woesebacteria bacterium RIFCSPHIGHO2_02_FULL_42_20]|uniref:RRM domain-containing protein n=1 Tax=Candidatus Woesebacteria bacterium RIFCSPHIGHO2_12_FULL_41_24 TaxID=1802510 RepID=A0A1F8ATS1_9BACT|nr:MAG: hypothetical protein A2W15_01685 [Candidatus Woesebacteria bacterium RBG_16_41_13]OGM29669.1 MAG: hypothetical protein A2873_02105 [Candidatus Woesebacteria bacterium RIFCSPHIGHO2_01_FULL_42_80]OGM35198.1 MAG: hypothetical protein A3D84_00185 [Candidatus Woesebacteria bacterium RIFCSPHIGHO2_02_FULL_42_20]OGM55091.1 MAG: hypothetical protein A3E44_04190 [Candidatus Woesebacteria bacterium RIFCSPHIGHO2_12_FULL_41_24]OGM67664.1 MAG: hypothetical protein A2969_01895 [Candidatus Woesebacteri